LTASCFDIIKCNMCERDSISMHDYRQRLLLAVSHTPKARQDRTHTYSHADTILSLLVLNFISVWGATQLFSLFLLLSFLYLFNRFMQVFCACMYTCACSADCVCVFVLVFVLMFVSVSIALKLLLCFYKYT